MPYNREINDRWTFRTADTKEFTHGYHVYPAMMIPQIARALIDEYAPEGRLSKIFDPYVGSGTTLVEASVKGIESIGTDLNPLARLMSKVKTTHYDESQILTQYNSIVSKLDSYNESKVINCNFDRISNYTYWYSSEILLKLAYMEQVISEDADNNDFFRLILAEIVREVSFTRNGEFKRFRMSEDKIATYNPNPFELFSKKFKRNFKGLQDYNASSDLTPSVTICDFNTTNGIPLDIIDYESVDMVVTSPPYGDSRTTVAYGQFSRWANEWFGFDNAKNLDNQLMGGARCREVEFKSIELVEVLGEIRSLDEKRYWEVVSFLNDYWKSIQNVAKAVRKGGRVCYVVGDRRVKGVQIPLDYFTAEMFEQCGFKHLNTIVREIPNKRMPSLTSPTNKTGNHVQTMNNEYIVILTKEQ
jgi:DNA modification methylase